MKYTTISAINEYSSETINPALFPDKVFEVYSVPVFDTGHPEYLQGNEIGSTKQVVKKNDILICKINPRINRVWVVSNESDKQNIASSEWIVVRNKEYNPEFLGWYFRSKKFKTLMVSEVTGIGGSLTRAQPKRVSGYPVPLLERKQQDAIVQCLNSIKKIIDARKKQLFSFDTLIKARFVEMFGDIIETVPLSFYIESLTAGKSLAGEEECQYKVLKTGAATYDYFDPLQVKNLPIDYIPLPEHQIHDGDIIISRMNTAELVGAAAYVWKAPERTYLPDRLWKAELTDKANPIFVWQALIQPTTKSAIRRIAGGTSGSMKNISKPGLLSLYVKKADLELQEQFAAFVSQVDKSKVVVQQALEKAQLLFDSLMQEYFG